MSLSLSWTLVDNTVSERFGNDPSKHLGDLFSSVPRKRKLHEKTKLLNERLSKCIHIKNYEQYVRTKLGVIKTIDGLRGNKYEKLLEAYSCNSKRKKVRESSKDEGVEASEILEKTMRNEKNRNLGHSPTSRSKQKSSGRKITGNPDDDCLEVQSNEKCFVVEEKMDFADRWSAISSSYNGASVGEKVIEPEDVSSANDEKVSTSLPLSQHSLSLESENEDNGDIENSMDLDDPFVVKMEECESEKVGLEDASAKEVGETRRVSCILEEKFHQVGTNFSSDDGVETNGKENTARIKETAPRITATEIVTNLRYRIITTDTETEDDEMDMDMDKDKDKDKGVAFQNDFHPHRRTLIVDVDNNESHALKHSVDETSKSNEASNEISKGVNDEKEKKEVEHEDEGNEEDDADEDEEFERTLENDVAHANDETAVINIAESEKSKSRNLNVASESESLKYVLSKLRLNTDDNEEYWDNQVYPLNNANEHEERDEEKSDENENAATPLFFQRRPVELREFIEGTEGRFEEMENPPVRKMKRLSENHQMWILDIPKNIRLKADELRGEDFILKNKTLKIGQNTFSFENRKFDEQVSCCLSIEGANETFNIVNVNTVSSMLVRKKRKKDSNRANEKVATPKLKQV